MKGNLKQRLFAILLCVAMVVTSVNLTDIFNNKINAAEEKEWEYNYTGNVQSFTAPYSGEYKLQIWGASGGGAHSTYGGLGGYSYGYVKLQKGETIYLEVGQQGSINGSATYNGGGAGGNGASSGGGATSITTTNKGELKNYNNDIKEVILVAGGGGGAGSKQTYSSLLNGSNITIGNGGGTVGTGVSKSVNCYGVTVATFSHSVTSDSGYAFGQGQSYSSEGGGAGGGGIYGGWASTKILDGTSGNVAGGSGGSGYVNPQSYIHVYNGKTSISNNIGNGKAKISYIGTYDVNVDILLNNNGTFNGETGVKVSLTVPCDTIIDFPDVIGTDGATFTGYSLLDGSTIVISNATLLGYCRRLQSDTDTLASIQSSFKYGKTPETKLKLLIGPIASGASVVTDPEIVEDIIANQDRDVLGIEMEIYGMYYAAYCGLNPKPKFIALKSVSDFANQGKNDDYHAYASYTSAKAFEILAKDYFVYD